ncbi:hypothetical protein BC834DRAFT_970028 [Gloeopeniophorella convolvens]|nr:hypothetical protein BC834DRAFT_970028 [Gloeopeniophorella convolvens]
MISARRGHLDHTSLYKVISSAPSLAPPAFQGTTVCVSILNAARIIIPANLLVQPHIPGHDVIDAPAYSFLIENDRTGQKILFDLGIVKAFATKSPTKWLNDIQSSGAKIEVPSDVPDILTAAGVPLTSINAIIWSHHHFDHTGDPSLFPPSTALIVGPGFKSHEDCYPGYPQNPDAHTLQDASGCLCRPRSILACGQKIGGLPALDWSRDGACARVAGQVRAAGGRRGHRAGEYRPTPLVLLPESIAPSPFGAPRAGAGAAVCPGAIFERPLPLKLTASLRARRAAPFGPRVVLVALSIHPFTLLLTLPRIWRHAALLHYRVRLPVFRRPELYPVN